MQNQHTVCEQIIEVCNRLFVYTDYREWEKLQSEVFAGEVHFDMTSMGAGAPAVLSADAICKAWEEGFQGLDAVHHLAGNYLVTIGENGADVFCYANASHFKKGATRGNTRTFVGSYNLHLISTDKGWRIDAFKYNLKYAKGNMDLI